MIDFQSQTKNQEEGKVKVVYLFLRKKLPFANVLILIIIFYELTLPLKYLQSKKTSDTNYFVYDLEITVYPYISKIRKILIYY